MGEVEHQARKTFEKREGVMKNVWIGFLLFLACLSAFADESIQEYEDSKFNEMMMMRLKNEQFFSYTAFPLPVELAVIQNYSKWIEKRYTEDQMLTAIEELKGEYQNYLPVFFAIFYTGEWNSKGKTEIKIPDDFEEYLFLENDKGEYVRTSKVEIPFMGNVVNYMNDSSMIVILFENADEILADSNKVVIVIGGVDLVQTKFAYPYPFSQYYQDAPEVIKELFYKSAIWE